MVDTTIMDELKALTKTERLRNNAKRCYSKKIRINPDFYTAEKERIKAYKKERYKNDPEYAAKMKQLAKEAYQKKKAKMIE